MTAVNPEYEPLPDAPPPGPQTTVTSGGDQTSSTGAHETATPETAAAVQAATAANLGVPAASEALAGPREDVDQAKLDAATEDKDQKWRDLIDSEANAQDWHDKLDAANKDKQAALDATKGLGFESMWAHASTGKKVLEGLGALATGMSGNTDAAKVLNDNIKAQVDQDHAIQRANIDQKYEQARMRGEDVNQLYSQWEHENGMQAAKEQRTHEYIAAKALEAQTRAGIPLSKAQAHVLVAQQMADATGKNVEMQRAFDRKATGTITRQLTPQVSTVTGQPGKQVTPAERKADAEVYSLTSDASPLLSKPLTADEKTAAYAIHKAMTPEKGGLEARAFDWAKDKISGVNVDKIPPESRARIDSAIRVIEHAAKGSGPDAFAKAMETIIPDESDKAGTKAKALKNLLTTEGAGTVRPNYWRAKEAEASKPAPAAAPGARYAPDIMAKAARAMQDPNAPPAAKEAARKVLAGR